MSPARRYATCAACYGRGFIANQDTDCPVCKGSGLTRHGQPAPVTLYNPIKEVLDDCFGVD